MKNLSIWIITLIALIVFLVGIFYYEILGAVVNVAVFIEIATFNLASRFTKRLELSIRLVFEDNTVSKKKNAVHLF